VQRLEYENGQLKGNTLANWKLRTGLMWSRLRVPVTSRAAEFWTAWSRWIKYMTEL